MDVPSGLGERGMSLWVSLSSGDVARDALVLEAARTADRLDELDSIIQGKGVLNLMVFKLDLPGGGDEPYSVEVKFQNVLAEARQQGAAMAGLLSKLGTGEAAKPASVAPVVELTPLEQMRLRRSKSS